MAIARNVQLWMGATVVAASVLPSALGQDRKAAPPAATAPAASPGALPDDPAILRGQLDNGLRYVVERHAVPPGRAVMWIHIHSGSLNETDRQRGIAHYLEHMAFNGSKQFAPGSLVPFFESLGMTFGRDQNAFTSYDQTTFQLSLPTATPDTLAKGMSFFVDVVGGLSLLPSEIDNERQIILEERRRGLSARQRIQDQLSERLYPGSLFGVREPIGTEETIKSVNETDFRDYYGRWYVPSNATLIVVADADPAEVVKAIKAQFGPLPKVPQPTPQAVNTTAYAQSFAVVVSDPELRTDDVRITSIGPARPPVRTEAQYRADLVERLGTSALNRRFGDKVAAGGTSYQSARVSISDEVNALHAVELSARPVAGKWHEALDEAALELERARAFGFTQRELDEVTKSLISGAERAVETQATAPSSALISQINNAVAAGEPVLSPKQRLDLLTKLLPTITPAEVSSSFAAAFGFEKAAFVAVLKPGDAMPSEAELLAAGTKALAVKPTPEVEVAHATTLMEHPPTTPGVVEEGSMHEASQVWSGWLGNNVRVHHRFMDERKNEVSVQIALIGGELLETADNRGITSAAQLAFSRPATKHLSSTDIRDLMNGKKVSAGGGGGFGGGRGGGRGGRGGGGGGGGDAISLSVSGSPEELETGFQLAYLLLTEPKIESAAFDQFLTSTRERIEESNTNPTAVGGRLASSILYPESDARHRPLEAKDLEHLTLDAAQSWLDKLLRESPVEVTIVGDISRDQAVELAAKYLGALPKRPRVDPTTYESLRHLQRPAGPRIAEKSLDTPTEQAFVAVGFYGADDSNRADVRALNMAARILSMRMVKEVREEAQLVYSISAASRPGTTYPGFGVFSASAPTDPAKASALVEKLQSMYAAFAKDGPNEEELATAKKQMATTYAEQVKEPSYWAGRMGQMTFRGTKLDDVLADPAAYQAMTVAEIKAAFAKYYGKDSSIVVVVKPEDNQAG